MLTPQQRTARAIGQARAVLLWEAALDLIRAGDTLRATGRAGRNTISDTNRYQTAEARYDALRGLPR